MFPHFSLGAFADRLEACPAIPIVSVGSGSGQVERVLAEHVKREWILVDPTPRKWRGANRSDTVEPWEPHYPTVTDLIHTRPSIVGECTLLLHWPYPNDSEYDIEAIRDLKPQCILLYYERMGAAGGILLHRWLSTFGESIQHEFPGERHEVTQEDITTYFPTETYTRRGLLVYYGIERWKMAWALLLLARVDVKDFGYTEHDPHEVKDTPWDTDYCRLQ